MYRNKKLLEVCRFIPCQHCGTDDGTVVAAHRNEGKGMGLKVSDTLVASLCFRCHSELDQGAKLTRDERRELWDAAHLRTLHTLIENGLLGVTNGTKK
ncbi:MAG: DUF1364 family protein [Alphaproteobacteria bacterium]|nr:DUF1364 family protein [Alphaproteobacteria bacterium]